MIKVKHLMDAHEPDDGQRLWVESSGLTRDLTQWCQVDHVLGNVAPPGELVEYLEAHPDDYDTFRGEYHRYLEASPFVHALSLLATAAAQEDYTLLHASSDPAHNAATALFDYLTERQAWI